MLLRDLTIENFRSFEKYQLNGLARVNLLVGDNNCGKTSVLEAVCLLASEGALESVAKLLDERGAVALVRDDHTSQYEMSVRLSELFHHIDGKPLSSAPIRIRSSSNGDLLLALGTPDDVRRFSTNLGIKNPLTSWSKLIFIKEYVDARLPNFPDSAVNSTTPAGNLVIEGLSTYLKRSWLVLQDDHLQPVAFVTTRLTSSDLLKSQWSELLESGGEGRVEEMMRVLVKDLSKIIFLPNPSSFSSSRADILLETPQGRRSLASYGDGVNRLLTLGIAIRSCEGGTALIDEIDTGLHYSRLPDMWRMVIKAAQELDVQVFATTHSLDCIRGLADAVKQDESLTGDVALFRIDRRSDEAVRFGGDELPTVAENEIEVR